MQVAATGAGSGEVALQVRAVLHDPVRPMAELYLGGKDGSMVKLPLTPGALTAPQPVFPLNGQLVVYDNPVVDPKAPETHLAAACKIPAGARRGILVLLPAGTGAKPPYRALFLEDSAKNFPMGESRVLTLLPVAAALEIGEHKLPVEPGKITRVPPVRSVNEFKRAQTNFYYKEDQSWVPFTERQLQYLDAYRRLFIVHVTPAAVQPSVSTILDTAVVK